MFANNTFPFFSLRFHDDIEIETGNQSDYNFVVDRSNMFRNSQGFLPYCALEKFIDEKRVLICRIGGLRYGYILTTGGMRKPLIVRHNTVDRDIWNCGFGRRWMEAVKIFAGEITKYKKLFVRTREDLAAQLKINFSIGGKVVAIDDRNNARNADVATFSVPCNLSHDMQKSREDCKFGTRIFFRPSVQS